MTKKRADLVMVQRLRQRLSEQELMKSADVATAFNVSTKVVRSWIDAGLIEAMNVGSKQRAQWMIYGPSVIAFCEQRQRQRFDI